MMKEKRLWAKQTVDCATCIQKPMRMLNTRAPSSALSRISIPDSVHEIGPSTFQNCSSLEAISLPKGVTEIGKNAFYGCSALKEIHIYNPLLLKQAGVGHDVKIILE